MNTVIAVDKELYDTVLKNSIRANDLDDENRRLKEINCWHSEQLWESSKRNQQLKELLIECREILEKETYDLMVKKIDNTIGERNDKVTA